MKRLVLGVLVLVGGIALGWSLRDLPRPEGLRIPDGISKIQLPDWLGSLVSGPAEQPPTQRRGADGGGRAAAPVEVATSRRIEATNDIRAVGSLPSDESVQLAAEIAGRIQDVVFSEGQAVRKGDVIVRIDDALARAELEQAEARLRLARANNERAKSLSRSGVVTGRSIDEAEATFETATAEVELARTRLDKHVLRAPFDGIAGVRNVSVGAFVSVGQAIVNIEKIDQLKVDFKVPELFLTAIGIGQEITLFVDALPERTFSGTIYAIDPAVDVNGRALSIRARLENNGLLLRPGLFARIVIQGLIKREVVMVPESAIVPIGGETLVYRIEDGKAVETKVQLGERRGAEVEIISGLDGEAVVVTAGQQRLRNGATVEIVEPGQPGGTGPAQSVGASNGSRS